MEHQIGQCELVRWQGSKSGRLKPRFGFWALLLSGSAIFGAAAMLAQSLGWMHLAGLSAFAPGAMIAFASTGPLVLFARAGLIWLAG